MLGHCWIYGNEHILQHRWKQKKNENETSLANVAQVLIASASMLAATRKENVE